MALHGKSALRKPHVQPRRNPFRAVTNHLFVGGQGLQLRVGSKHAKRFFQHVIAVQCIPIHEDNQVILVHTVSIDGSQNHANGHALAGLVLAQKHQFQQIIGDVLAMGFHERPNDQFVVCAARSDIDRGGDLLALHLSQNGSDHTLGDGGLFEIGGHLNVQPPWSPARRPNCTRLRPHSRPTKPAIRLGPDGMGEPPTEPPQP